MVQEIRNFFFRWLFLLLILTWGAIFILPLIIFSRYVNFWYCLEFSAKNTTILIIIALFWLFISILLLYYPVKLLMKLFNINSLHDQFLFVMWNERLSILSLTTTLETKGITYWYIAVRLVIFVYIFLRLDLFQYYLLVNNIILHRIWCNN